MISLLHFPLSGCVGLDNAAIHLCQAKLLLRRARTKAMNQKERHKINRLLEICDEGIRLAAERDTR